MPMGCWIRDEHEFFPSRISGWSHAVRSRHVFVRDTVASPSTRSWSAVTPLPFDSHLLNKYKRVRTDRGPRNSDRGTFGYSCPVRKPSPNPPGRRLTWAEPFPQSQEEGAVCRRSNTWLSEHFKLTCAHIPDRVPLPDKGKPVVKQGRKATDQISDLNAGLPEEE